MSISFYASFATNKFRSYHYLIPEHGWYSIPEAYSGYQIDTPVGYDDKDIEYFTSFAPCVIDCSHENLIRATCTDNAFCFTCGFIPQGGEALGHNIVQDKGFDPDCTEDGLSFGEHCTRCDDRTIPQEAIPALGHSDENFDHICDNECGKEDVEKHEDTDKNHACDYGCTECGEERTVTHTLTDADCDTPKTCTVCGATDGEALGHTPEADDGDCTTAITCSVCGTTTTPAKDCHTGGEATCQSGKICTLCNREYTGKNAENHTSDICTYDPFGADIHTRDHACCDTMDTESEPHEFISFTVKEFEFMEIKFVFHLFNSFLNLQI